MKFGKYLKFNALAAILLSFLMAKTETEAKSFLWEIKSGTGTVYLLGSIHMGRQDMYPLPTAMEMAFAHSDTLVVEVKLDNLDPFAVMSKATYPDSTNLKKQVSPEVFAEIKKRFDKMGKKEEEYINYKPWFIAMLLTTGEAQDDGYQSAEGVDLYFMEKARKNYKPVDEIESFNEQIAVLDSFDKQPDVFLKYTLDDANNTTNELDSMVTAWKAGDADKMSQLITQGLNDPAFNDIKQALFDKRNVKMAKKIEEYLKSSSPHLVIVGAGHIAGKNGILDILSKNDKYKIEQQ